MSRSFPTTKMFTHSKGFILPFSMLITTLILFITTGSMTLLSKQFYFSKLYKQSQAAYYAADDALACTIAIDDTYLAADGLGVFPSSTSTDGMAYISSTIDHVNTLRQTSGLPTSDIDEVACAQSPIFDTQVSHFQVATATYYYQSPNAGVEEGRTSVFNMRMDIGNGQFRCAKVTVNKTLSFRQIIAQGYSTCDNSNAAVERAVVNTTIAE